MNKFYPNSRIEPETYVSRPDITKKSRKKVNVFSDFRKKISLSGSFIPTRNTARKNSRDNRDGGRQNNSRGR